jgi:hypothetical protein
LSSSTKKEVKPIVIANGIGAAPPPPPPPHDDSKNNITKI